MRIINGTDIRSDAPSAVALGTFDGVHLGHRRVISAAVAAAREEGLIPTVFTFSDLPKNAFLPEADRIAPLCTFMEKAELIESLGVELLIAPDFALVKDLTAEEFINDIIIDRLRASHVVCGEDHRFGAGGRGDASLLIKLCLPKGVAVTLVPPVKCRGERISSTLIRALISEGKEAEAKKLLGV